MSASTDQPRRDGWLEALSKADRCPWPGPRPFNATDPPEQLIGRDEDRTRFRHVVEQHRLIFLTGASGVGKSSLLEAGLVPELEHAGSTVVVCREWGGKDATASAASFLAEKIHAALAARGMLTRPAPDSGDYSRDRRLFWELRDDLGARVVLVLDQFEELIRYTPSLRDELYGVLAEVNARLPMKVVISFRDEYLLQLRPLQRQAQPFSIAEYVLEEVEPERVCEIVCSANGPGSEAITSAAAGLLVDRWHEARRTIAADVDANPLLRIGLLHLQALLYALHDRTGRGVVTEETVRAFAVDRPGAELFLAGLDESIDVKLERCRTAGRDADLDQFLVEGTAHIVARLVRHLSSAGYKLVRGAHDLAQATMAKEIGVLRRDIRCDSWSFTALLDAVIDSLARVREPAGAEIRLLDDDHATIARDADRRRRSLTAVPPIGDDWETSVGKEPNPLLADPANLTSGPMRGLPPATVLIEELRRFVFALMWLDRTSLVRLSSPGSGGLMVSLIHDGFGEALLRWSDARLELPEGALHAITGSHGDSFEWKRTGPYRRTAESMVWNETPRIISNLRWRGSGVYADLRRVVFVNCDFRSAFFRDCELDGVTFLNCMLENAVLMSCRISSAPSHEQRRAVELPRLEVEPTFHVPSSAAHAPGVDPAELRTAAAYRGIEGDRFTLLAPPPDLPAIPVTEFERDAVSAWEPQLGGIAIYGSRVTSMVIRYCSGDVALHRCTGEGFGIDDHGGGHLQLHGCTLRQVRVTAGEDGRPIHIRCSDSALAQLWLGEDLCGSFAAERGTLVHAWNESETFDAVATRAAVHGTVGVQLESCRPLRGLEDLFARTERIRSTDAFKASGDEDSVA